MAKWQTTIKIGDLHAAYKRDSDIEALTTGVAARIKANRLWEEFNDLDDIAEDMLTVETVEDYDDCLLRLYDFGDAGYRIWVDTEEVSNG